MSTPRNNAFPARLPSDVEARSNDVEGSQPASAYPSTFHDLMALERIAPDFYIGNSPDYVWGRLFGGQVVAQALRAAYATVDAPHRVHSLHAYFVLGGIPKHHVLYEVDRLRDGRSFTTRRVVARQGSGAILNLDASFQKDESEADVQARSIASDVLPPDSVPSNNWTGMAEVRELEQPSQPGRSWVWMRMNNDLGDDWVLHDCALAYMSDHNPMDAMVSAHPSGVSWQEMMTTSLDHNIWFHRRVRADDWILFDMHANDLMNGRGLSIGSVHSIQGTQAATVAQEGLVRGPR